MTPVDYLREAFRIIETNAYYQPSPAMWRPLKTRLLTEAEQAQNIPAVYPLLRHALKALNDGHSHLYIPGQRRRKKSGTKQTASAKALPEGKRLDRWGYMHLPKATGTDEAFYERYAATGHEIIRRVGDVSGWILDLRTNGGGNSWPMLAAAGPLIGEGDCCFFVSRTGQRNTISYRKGASAWNGEAIYTVENPVQPLPDTVPVAVLISYRTGSAGEIVLIACLGRPNLQTFGQLSRGIPTANTRFAMPDVSGEDVFLTLTTHISADRRGRTYDSHIRPDMTCHDALTAAQVWLSRQT